MPTEKEEYARPARPPDTSSLAEAREASGKCTACHLYKRATQTVFGEGPKGAPMMLVGEQPGDYEDVAGKPFVGPAGKIMDRALAEAGIDRSQVFVTNAVKHFKWEPRGKRRIHQKPPMARGGATLGETEIIGLPRGDRGSSDLRPVIPRYAPARQSVVVQVCAPRPCHGSPILSATTARRGIARTRVQAVRCRSSRRFESRRRGVKSTRALSQAAVFPVLPSCRPLLRRGRSSGLLRLHCLLFSLSWGSELHCFRFQRAVSLLQI